MHNNATKFYQSPIIVIMLLLFFSLVAATAYRVLIAVDTHPGLVSADPYEKGENYSSVLQNRVNLSQAGYVLEVITPKESKHQKSQTYQVSITQNGVAVSNASVVGHLYRSADKSADFQVKFQALGEDLYQANITLPLKGRWDLIVEASKQVNQPKSHYLQRKAKKLFAYE